jgi:DeoR/GlpR family transcriptional regulator of sugar metabolism
VLLVDHTKFGQRALSKVLDISQIHAVVTDDQTPKKDIAALERAGKKVYVAGQEPAHAA